MHQNDGSKRNHLKMLQQKSFKFLVRNFFNSKVKTKYAKSFHPFTTNCIFSKWKNQFAGKFCLQLKSCSLLLFLHLLFITSLKFIDLLTLRSRAFVTKFLMVINLWYIKALKLLTTMVNNISCFVKESHKNFRPLTPSVLSLSHKSTHYKNKWKSY